MRGTDEASGSLFSYAGLEERIPARHPLRKIRQVVNDALASLDAGFEALYTDSGRPSIAPERPICHRLGIAQQCPERGRPLPGR
ncbi:transposase ISMca1 [Leisingera methylohalidivorans DSM 14336]|uniref:Transposase ISMca1 n=1 Tax=Leisingera methylohalidivorans DSM 14336 TaxID=999552 RepID=V9VT46_9RHOB|nr:transposase ISMca1 [Leisingera methylohalidivorans DSM 14336]